jgi:putative transcriptional regulator
MAYTLIAGRLKPGRVCKFNPVFVKNIRAKLHASQAQCAHLIGVSVDTLQNWAQGRRSPAGPALVLLKIAERNPTIIVVALHHPTIE